MRRYLIAPLVALVLCAGVLAGCGSTGKTVGGIVVHHIANHVAPSHQRTINKAFCAYHGVRAYKDIKSHHYLNAGVNAYEAAKSCKKGFGHK